MSFRSEEQTGLFRKRCYLALHKLYGSRLVPALIVPTRSIFLTVVPLKPYQRRQTSGRIESPSNSSWLSRAHPQTIVL